MYAKTFFGGLGEGNSHFIIRLRKQDITSNLPIIVSIFQRTFCTCLSVTLRVLSTSWRAWPRPDPGKLRTAFTTLCWSTCFIFTRYNSGSQPLLRGPQVLPEHSQIVVYSGIWLINTQIIHYSDALFLLLTGQENAHKLSAIQITIRIKKSSFQITIWITDIPLLDYFWPFEYQTKTVFRSPV